jgi:hypothetical protein
MEDVAYVTSGDHRGETCRCVRQDRKGTYVEYNDGTRRWRDYEGLVRIGDVWAEYAECNTCARPGEYGERCVHRPCRGRNEGPRFSWDMEPVVESDDPADDWGNGSD